MTTDDLEAPLFPRWVTFIGAFTCFMATALALMAQTARGAQTEEVAPEERRKCASIRALCNFFCTRPPARSCWKNLLLKMFILLSASGASTGLSLLITNLTSTDKESAAATIRVLINEVLGVESVADTNNQRLKREADCFLTNDSSARCPPLTPPPCNPASLLQADMDSEWPAACTILVFNILFATLACMFLAVSAAATLICGKMKTHLFPDKLEIGRPTTPSPPPEDTLVSATQRNDTDDPTMIASVGQPSSEPVIGAAAEAAPPV